MKLLLSCLALGLLVVLALLVRGLGEEEAIPVREVDGAVSSVQRTTELKHLAADQPDHNRETRSPAEITESHSSQTLVLAGSLRIETREGEERSTPSGTLVFKLRTDRGSHYARASVNGGHWRVETTRRSDGTYNNTTKFLLPYPSEIADSVISLDNASIRDIAGTLLQLGDAQEYKFGQQDVEIALRELPPFQLYVTDAETGAPLELVTVLVAIGDAQDGDVPRRGFVEHSFAEQAESPVTIPQSNLRPPSQTGEPRSKSIPTSRWDCFVGCSGYAWRLVELNVKDGEELHIELQRAAQVRVSLLGTRSPGSELRIYKHGRARPVSSTGIGILRAHTFSDLLPGNYRVAAEIGPWDESPIVLGEARVYLEAVPWNKVAIDLTPAPKLERTTLQGSVHVPHSWADEKFWLAFDLQDLALDGSTAHHVVSKNSLVSMGGLGVNYSFELEALQVGKYSLRVNPLGYGYEFQLSPGELNQISITLPELLEVTVLVRDETTQQPAETSTLAWRQPNFRGHHLISKQAKRAEGEEKFHLRVPAGSLTVKSPQGRYTAAEKTVQAEDGLEIVLSVRPID